MKTSKEARRIVNWLRSRNAKAQPKAGKRPNGKIGWQDNLWLERLLCTQPDGKWPKEMGE